METTTKKYLKYKFEVDTTSAIKFEFDHKKFFNVDFGLK